MLTLNTWMILFQCVKITMDFFIYTLQKFELAKILKSFTVEYQSIAV